SGSGHGNAAGVHAPTFAPFRQGGRNLVRLLLPGLGAHMRGTFLLGISLSRPQGGKRAGYLVPACGFLFRYPARTAFPVPAPTLPLAGRRFHRGFRRRGGIPERPFIRSRRIALAADPPPPDLQPAIADPSAAGDSAIFQRLGRWP